MGGRGQTAVGIIGSHRNGVVRSPKNMCVLFFCLGLGLTSVRFGMVGWMYWVHSAGFVWAKQGFDFGRITGCICVCYREILIAGLLEREREIFLNSMDRIGMTRRSMR